MARRVFFSFHFANDFWRTQQVRNMNALDGQTLCTANAWEEIKKKGDQAVKDWVDENMQGKSCVIVLVGAETASRKWVKHEIIKGWNDNRGVLGIRINKLLDIHSQPSVQGANPFSQIKFESGESLDKYLTLHNPAGADSKAVYASIRDNIESWIEDAIAARK